jgi:predicted ferric reductase
VTRHQSRKKNLPARFRVRIVAWLAGAALVAATFAGYGLRDAFTPPVLGEAAGVIAVVFIVASLVLMLRLPALARACGGLETMYGLHRGFGLAGYGFALAHPLLLAWHSGWSVLGYGDKDFGFRSGWTAALVLMVILLFTFILKNRGYAIWRRVHTLSMVAVLAMAWHVAAYQSDLPLAGRIVLAGLLALGVLIPLLRHVLIDRGALSTRFVVESVGHPIEGVIDMHLKPARAALAIQPGQFVFARFQPGGSYRGCGHFHPFTASAVGGDGSLRLSIKASGACTRAMQHVEPGTEANLQGPFGNLFQNVRESSQVWIAGGIGVTPFLARVRALDEQHVPVRLFYFFDTIQDAAYVEELEALARARPMLSLHCVATHGTPAMIGSIFDALLPPWNDKHYVLCGSDGFTAFVRAYLAEHRVKPDAIAQERFEFR